ncbi:Uncharacterised protein [Escherichia coli]|uniref:Uncharacterized protein n=1 Tax=Escherichia coli TaxID=562 RepID=A0A2X3K5R9_ECOLX|nr:Uncharacterised protein [Escherichia coli]
MAEYRHPNSLNRSVPSAPPPPFGRLFVFYSSTLLPAQASLYRFQSRYAGGWHRQNGYIAKRVHHYQRHRFIIDNRTHHQTMARRIGKAGFG